MKVLVTQSCPTLCNPMDCSPPGSSVHGILQARTLEWAAMPFCICWSVAASQCCVSSCRAAECTSHTHMCTPSLWTPSHSGRHRALRKAPGLYSRLTLVVCFMPSIGTSSLSKGRASASAPVAVLHADSTISRAPVKVCICILLHCEYNEEMKPMFKALVYSGLDDGFITAAYLLSSGSVVSDSLPPHGL